MALDRKKRFIIIRTKYFIETPSQKKTEIMFFYFC